MSQSAITLEGLKALSPQIAALTKIALAASVVVGTDPTKSGFQAMPPMPDPAAQGGMPPGAMPPGAMPPGADPSMMVGAMPPGADPNAPPQMDPQLLEVIDQISVQLEQLVNAVSQLAQQVQAIQQENQAMKAQLSAPPEQPAADPVMAAAGGGGGMM